MKTLMTIFTFVMMVYSATATMSQSEIEKAWEGIKETNDRQVYRVWQTFNSRFNLQQWHREIQYLFPDGDVPPIYINNQKADYKKTMKFDDNSEIVVMLKLGHKFAPFSQEYTEAYNLGNWYPCKEDAIKAAREKYPNEEQLGDEEILKKYKFAYGELCMTKILPRIVKPVEEAGVYSSKEVVDWMKKNVVILCSLLAIFATGGYLFTHKTN